jgi:hypothetical protein
MWRNKFYGLICPPPTSNLMSLVIVIHQLSGKSMAAVIEVFIQHLDAVPAVPSWGTVKHQSTLPLYPTQGQHTHPQVPGGLLGGYDCHPTLCHADYEIQARRPGWQA